MRGWFGFPRRSWYHEHLGDAVNWYRNDVFDWWAITVFFTFILGAAAWVAAAIHAMGPV